jgi:hypothetical protein
MSTGWKFTKVAGGLILCAAILRAERLSSAQTASSQIQQTHNQRTHNQQTHKKTKKPPTPPPDLANGPTGPVPPIPLDSMAPVPPQVRYENAQLTIVAPNSTLADILRAVRKQTGAEIDVPTAPERVVTHLGPGPAREVVAELLNGSRFNYVLLGSPGNNEGLTRVLLVARTDGPPSAPQLPNVAQAQPEPEVNAVEETDPAADEAAAEAEQPAPPPATAAEQPGAKSPQEMLQEMQQRQLQLQQQQVPGQPPVPGSGIPPRMPPDQAPQQ